MTTTKNPKTGWNQKTGLYYPDTVEQLQAAIAADMNGGRIVLSIPLMMDVCTRIKDLEEKP